MTTDGDDFEAGYQAGYRKAQEELDGKADELTHADVKAMSEAEINRRWPEVQRALSNAGKTG